MLVVVDLGNSALKFGAFRDGALIATERVEGGRETARGVIPFSYFSMADEVVIAASAPDQIVHLLERVERAVRVLGDEVQQVAGRAYADPSELGIDRVAAAWGARELVGGATVVVDAGTAVTVDAVRADGSVVPVAIAPGPMTAARGLRAIAPHLPWPSLSEGDVAIPANGTGGSLRAGFVLGFAGLIDRLAAAAGEALGEAAPVVLTGGYAPLLRPHLATSVRHEPHAVLHGIRALHGEVPAA
jgi:type III pantothenate kinase